MYIVAGGAPMLVADWAAYGAAQPAALVTPSTIAAMPRVPADGTYLQGAGLSSVYLVSGGALTLVSTWGPGGPPPTVPVPADTIGRMAWAPASVQPAHMRARWQLASS